jgi:two-component system sensor histidine kinase FlrB
MNIHNFKTGIIIVNPDGIVVEANNNVGVLLGRDIKGETWSKIYLDNFTMEISGLFYSLRDGNYVGLEINQDGDNQVIFIIDYTKLVDIIEAKAKTMRLLALGEMAGSISHQIKTPLSIAGLQAEMLLDNNQDSSDETKIKKIISSLDSITNLLDEMLVFSTDNKVEAINSFEVINELQHIYPDTSIERHGSNIGFVGNNKMIINMLTNIVNNSLETKSSNPRIVIKSAISGTFCKFTYSDNCGGVGEDIDIFSRNQSTKEQGSGIGMNVVKFIVEAHGGHINYKKNINEGILININIPLEKSMQGGS